VSVSTWTMKMNTSGRRKEGTRTRRKSRKLIRGKLCTDGKGVGSGVDLRLQEIIK
jgi:hypothetical protein